MNASERAAPVFLPLENPLARGMREARYRFAVARVPAGRVLEAGCGARDGGVRLASAGAVVVAVDISDEAVARAAVAYPHPRVRYATMDCQRLAWRDGSFDAVVSFEVLEHVPDMEAYVREMARVLSADGVYVGSTPNRERPDYRPNPDHVEELTAPEYRALLERFFGEVQLFGGWPDAVVEGRGVGIRRALTRSDRFTLRRLVPQPLKDVINRGLFRLKSAHLVDGSDYHFSPDRLEDAAVLVAVCRRPRRGP